MESTVKFKYKEYLSDPKTKKNNLFQFNHKFIYLFNIFS